MSSQRVTLDLLTMGRIGVDIYPLQTGVGLEDVETFGKFLGGSAANVAVAAARHGLRAGIVTAVGDDPFGRFLIRELGRLGVSSEHVTADPARATPVTFCELFPPDDFPLHFYRADAPDLAIRAEGLDLAAIRAARVLWMTVTGLSREPSREAHAAALRAREEGNGWNVLDLDYRAMLWESPEAARERIEPVLAASRIAIGNLEECFVAVGERDPERAADALLERGAEIAVVKRGPLGVLAKTREERAEVPPIAVEVVNGLGAGDSFGGAFCHGLLAGWGLERIVRFANAAGALVATRLECSTAMPGSEEVEQLLAARGGQP